MFPNVKKVLKFQKKRTNTQQHYVLYVKTKVAE